jgi:DNA integrity scanning protein DisA with diadenylate cyclase activity
MSQPPTLPPLGAALPGAVTHVRSSGAFHEALVVAQIVVHLKNEMQGVDLNATKLKPSFIQFVLSKIKTVVVSSKSTLEKDQLKDLLIQVLGQLVTLAPAEVKVVEDVFEMLSKNHLIKAVDRSIRGRIKGLFKKRG